MTDRFYDRDDRDRLGRDPADGRGRSREWTRGDDSRYRRHDRDFFERAGDEVRSWFGDDEAARRREMDERRHERDRGWAGPRSNRTWRDRGAFDEWDREYGPRDRDRGDDDRSWLGEPRWSREFVGGHEGRDRGYETRGSSWSAAAGPFAGKGPRGYQRSDERIREDVCDRLTVNGDVDASNIEVEVVGAEVTLRGMVDSRFARRSAEDIAESVHGVKHVHNEIRVGQPADASGTGGASGGMNAGPGGTAAATMGDPSARARERVR